MPPKERPVREKTLHDVVEDVGSYPIEAFDFVQRGLGYTVQQIYGQQPAAEEGAHCHVSGQQLCEGLREFALMQWGMLARTVLRRWNITHTIDFGRIVFALVDNGLMQKTDEDSLDDFRNVYDFKTAFESGYRIKCPS